MEQIKFVIRGVCTNTKIVWGRQRLYPIIFCLFTVGFSSTNCTPFSFRWQTDWTCIFTLSVGGQLCAGQTLALQKTNHFSPISRTATGSFCQFVPLCSALMSSVPLHVTHWTQTCPPATCWHCSEETRPSGCCSLYLWISSSATNAAELFLLFTTPGRVSRVDWTSVSVFSLLALCHHQASAAPSTAVFFNQCVMGNCPVSFNWSKNTLFRALCASLFKSCKDINFVFGDCSNEVGLCPSTSGLCSPNQKCRNNYINTNNYLFGQ